MIKKIVVFILFSILLNAQVTSLSDAIDLALSKNLEIKRYEERLIQKEFGNQKAWGNFLPTIDFDYSYNRLDDDLTIDLAPIRNGIISLQANTQTEIANIYSIIQTGQALQDAQKLAFLNQAVQQLDNLIPAFASTLKQKEYQKAGLTAIQPLFVGGKLLAAKKNAAAEQSVAEQELIQIKNKIIIETVSSYLKLVLMNNVINTRKDLVTGIKEHYNRAEKLYNEGYISNHNVLRAQVALAEATRNLENDKDNLVLSTLALKEKIGVSDSLFVQVNDTLLFKEIDLSIEVLRSQMKDHQPLFRILQQKLISAEQKFNSAKASFLPQVAAFGRYEVYPQYLSALEPRWAVGIQLKMNLFNGFKDYADIQSASYLENEVRLIKSDVERKIDLLLNSKLTEFNSSKRNYLKLELDLQLAKENLRVNEKRFESGLGISLEVIDAQLSLEKTELDRIINLYQYYQTLAKIYETVGTPIKILDLYN